MVLVPEISLSKRSGDIRKMQWFFEIPATLFPDDVISVVRSVSKEWSWVSGQLYAPQTMVDKGQIATTTRIMLDGYYTTESVVVDLDRGDGYCADYLAILLERKYPALLELEGAGYNNNPFPFATAQELVEGYLSLGYGKGGLTYYKCGHGRVITLSVYLGANSKCPWEQHWPGSARPLAIATYEGDHPSYRKDADQILDSLRKIGLKEIGPASPAEP